MAGPRYTYGDTAMAAERLALVARTFEPASRAFLERHAHAPARLALDLGCGPGHTTRLLHEVVGAARTVGLDASDAFLEQARRSAPPGVTFMRHDASRLPFPVAPAPDVVYARLLLAHLPDPAGVLARWATATAPGGLLLVDDLEAIETDEPAFRTYRDQVAVPLVGSEGGHLLVGPVLHAAADPTGTERVADGVVTFVPEVAVSARLFRMNLAVLVERGEVPARPDLSESLRAIADGEVPARPIRWHMRQLALRCCDS